MPLSWHWAAVSWHFRLLGDQCAGAWVAGGRGSHVAGARQSPRRRWTSFVSLRAVSQCGFVHLGVQCVCVAPAGQEFLGCGTGSPACQVPSARLRCTTPRGCRTTFPWRLQKVRKAGSGGWGRGSDGGMSAEAKSVVGERT